MALTLIVAFLLQGLCETEALSVTGIEGNEINITCIHSYADSNMKYFCKQPCKNNKDILIRSTEKNMLANTKYRIEDRGNIFHVIIDPLKMEDSGTYWCGIDRVGVDTYNEVLITVMKGKKDAEGSLGRNTSASFPQKLIYISAGLGMIVLALVTLIWIFVKHQKRNNSSGRDPEVLYSTLSFKKGGPDHDTTPSSAIEHRGANSNAPSQPPNPTDGIIYSTVRSGTHSAHHGTIAPHSVTEEPSSI